MTPAEFRTLLTTLPVPRIVDEHILAPGAAHVSDAQITHIKQALMTEFELPGSEVDIVIVGSAKLGFSLREKWDGTEKLPRYREFGPLSDVDVAVVSRSLYLTLWRQIAAHLHNRPSLPHATKLGDYMQYGWLRPDHFHLILPPSLCNKWWDQFSAFSRDTTFGRRKIHGALYYDRAFLHAYQERSVNDCIAAEELLK